MTTTAPKARRTAPAPSVGLDALDEFIAHADGDRGELSRLSAAMHRVESDGGVRILDLLEVLAAQSAPVRKPSEVFTSEQEAALRDAGSFVDDAPPYVDRASTRSAVVGAKIMAGALDTAQVAALLGRGTSRVRQRAGERSLIALPSRQGLRFPLFQFTGEGELPGWSSVAPSFPVDAHPFAIDRFLGSPNDDLAVDGDVVSPRDWLLAGGSPDLVVQAVNDAYSIA